MRHRDLHVIQEIMDELSDFGFSWVTFADARNIVSLIASFLLMHYNIEAGEDDG